MARARARVRPGLSEPELERLYGTEDQCRATIMAARWPDGVDCPACSGTRHNIVTTRGFSQCSACDPQASVIAGPIFVAT